MVANYIKDKVDQAGDAVSSAVDSVSTSIDQIVDSSGDFIRAIGRGDISGAGEDLLSIGWEASNIISGGSLNALANTIRRNLIPDLPPVDYQDRKAMARSASEARRIVYGTTRVGGVVRYFESSGDDSQTMHIIVIFAAHSCSDISRVYFDDELAFVGTTAQGKFVDKATMIYETGKQTGANTAIVSSTPAGWTSSHKLLGQTYAYLKLEYDNDVYSGIPNIDALVIGNDEIFDPRTSLTGYTDNQALVVRDYIVKSYGYGYSLVNDASFIEGANICDESVTKGNGLFESRYTANGAVSIIDSPQVGLDALNAAGSSQTVFSQGEIFYIPGEFSTPTESYSESDFIGGIQLVPTSSAANRINTIGGTYIDPDQNYELVDFVPIEISEYVTQDRQELREDSKFPFANSGTLARRLAKLYLEQTRYGVALTGLMGFSALQHKVGDRIYVSIDKLGWSNRVFRIISMEMGLRGVDVTLQEDDESVWDWQEGDALAVEAPPALDIPDGSFTTEPQNVLISESLYIANDKKTVRSRISLAWDGSTTTRNWEIEGSYSSGGFVTLSDYLSAPSFDLNDAQVGEWLFRIRSRNNIGVASEWVYVDFTSLGKEAPPADVAGFTGLVRPFGVEFRWDSIPDLDFDYYELRVGESWELGQKIQSLSAIRWQWETRPTGSERVFIKAFDTTGNESLNASEAFFIIENPSKVAPLTASVIDNNVLLRWVDATTSFAIDYYEIQRGDTLNEATVVGTAKSTFANLFETESATYTYWVAGVDIQGNKGEFISIDANVDQPPDFTLQSDQLLDLSLGTKVNAKEEIGESITADTDEITADSADITADAGPSFAILAPVNTTETWLEHFEALPGHSAFTTADDDTITADTDAVTADTGSQTIRDLQIDNGYPFYLQPTPSTASYEQVIDFLGNFSLSRINLTPDVDILADNPAIAYTIGYSSDNITYVDVPGTEANGRDFRYVRVKADITSTGGQDLLRINSLRLKLDVKLRTDEGSESALASDSGGTVVNFNADFVDVISIQVSPNSTNSYKAVYDFVDVPNPTSFKVLVFDDNGNRVDSDFSWTARGV